MSVNKRLVNLTHADKIIHAKPTQDGDGVQIQRIAGKSVNALLDPFLLIDQLKSNNEADYVGGFPAHPHRGFQTLTYMIEGAFRHRDSMGNEGVIGSGGLQWMSAASGVIHSEMPEVENGRLHGFQLWLNLPAKDKMRPPEYRDIQRESMTKLALSGGGQVKLLVGSLVVNDCVLEGPLQLTESSAVLMDVYLRHGEEILIDLPKENQFNALVYDGDIQGLCSGELAHMSVNKSEDTVLSIKADDGDVRILLLGGKPILEPVVQYGPFVMNTVEEIDQAISDYQEGRLVK